MDVSISCDCLCQITASLRHEYSFLCSAYNHKAVFREQRISSSMLEIQICADKADADGLRYFWIDTCCIDKKNSTELSKAINSMFRWYQNAARCYVYLTDVSVYDGKETPQQCLFHWETTLKKSRWFTRGW